MHLADVAVAQLILDHAPRDAVEIERAAEALSLARRGSNHASCKSYMTLSTIRKRSTA